MVRRLTGEGARRIDVGALVHSDAETVDELAAEPAGHQRRQDTGHGKADVEPAGRGGEVPPQKPAQDEEQQDHHVPAPVQETDPLGPRPAGEISSSS